MGKLIGPIEDSDWSAMLLLKKSIAYMTNEDYSKYVKAIRKERNILKIFFDKYINANNN